MPGWGWTAGPCAEPDNQEDHGYLAVAAGSAAVDATAAWLAEADLDAVPVTEGIARVARVAAGGSKYAAVIGQSRPGYAGAVEQQIKALIQALLRRGIEDGTFRGDLSVDELVLLLGSLLEAAARLAAEDLAGVEKAAALVTSVFLHGTERRTDATGQDRPSAITPGRSR